MDMFTRAVWVWQRSGSADPALTVTPLRKALRLSKPDLHDWVQAAKPSRCFETQGLQRHLLI
jgi:hypothetical protein